MKQKTDPDSPQYPVPVRYCGMDDFTPQIAADSGAWAEVEILNAAAVVKVRAGPATLSAIAAAAGFSRLPLERLGDHLSSLNNSQRTAIRNRLNAIGYTDAEIVSALGSLALNTVTLGQVLRFAASRRFAYLWDATNQVFAARGPAIDCESIDALDTSLPA
jgi:hypothetical protein